MTQQHPILRTLHEWEQLTDLDTSDDAKKDDKSCPELGLELLKLTTKKRGKAQQLPSPLLQPV